MLIFGKLMKRRFQWYICLPTFLLPYLLCVQSSKSYRKGSVLTEPPPPSPKHPWDIPVVLMRKLHQWGVSLVSVRYQYQSDIYLQQLLEICSICEWIDLNGKCLKFILIGNAKSSWIMMVFRIDLMMFSPIVWKIQKNLECNQYWSCLHHTLISFWTFRYQLLWEYTGWCIPWKLFF